MKEFFVSDTHFGHGNVIKYCSRPFSSTDEMDEAIIQRWNSVVGKADRVWHLGDVSFRSAEPTARILDRLNGHITLVKGNHDSRNRNRARFDDVVDYVELNSHSRKIVLMHFPIESWNNMSHGSIHLHGHSHGSSRPVANRFDVGVDCWDFYPVTLQHIMDTKGVTATQSRPDRNRNSSALPTAGVEVGTPSS